MVAVWSSHLKDSDGGVAGMRGGSAGDSRKIGSLDREGSAGVHLH
jgi:hypothetical protein